MDEQDLENIAYMTTEEKLQRAKAKQYYLIVNRDAMVSSGADGVSINHDLNLLETLIQRLEKELAQENTQGGGLWQQVIDLGSL